MPHDEPNYGSVGPEVQEASKATFSGLSSNLSSVIEARLLDFHCLQKALLFFPNHCL